MNNKRGFTLVEMAAVLVIISLLLGSILKGRELIFDSKVRRCQNDLKTIASAIYTYSNRYYALPGDDTKADRWSGVAVGDGNGKVEGDWNSTSAGDESRLAWLHLREARFIIGTGTDLANHAFSGQIGIGFGFMSIKNTVVCINNIPADAADIIDNQMDDGNRKEGNIRGDVNATLTTKPTAVSYTEGNLYTLCYEV